MSIRWDASGFAEDAIPFLNENGDPVKPALVVRDDERGAYLYHGDCRAVMDAIIEKHPEGCFDMIFADPPYRLSNGGMTCYAGRAVKVDKGNWDQSEGPELDYVFTEGWLAQCQKLLKKNGTIWVSGTHHIIHIVGYAMQRLGFKLLNEITWEKPNPPPNLSCRYFTHSTETILWAAKGRDSKHRFNYSEMRFEAGNRQMKTVWTMTSPSKSEKYLGKHPTQKPLSLIHRCIRASTIEGDFIFDPFSGSSTTGVAALQMRRRFCGVEKDNDFIALSKRRLNYD